MGQKRKRGSPPDPTSAARLRLILAERDADQITLARDSGTQQSQVSRYVNGERDVTCGTMMLWCHALGIRVGWLLSGEGTPYARVATDAEALADPKARERARELA